LDARVGLLAKEAAPGPQVLPRSASRNKKPADT